MLFYYYYLLLYFIMEPSEFESTFGDTLSAAFVATRGPPRIENIPFKIPMRIVDRVMSNRYAGDGTVHPGYHLLFMREICGLFKIAGVSIEVIMRKLFSLSLKDKAMEDSVHRVEMPGPKLPPHRSSFSRRLSPVTRPGKTRLRRTPWSACSLPRW